MFTCSACHYSSDKLVNYNKHLKTAKHKKNAPKSSCEDNVCKDKEICYFKPHTLIPDEYIHNYGSERIDYIDDQLFTIFVKEFNIFSVNKFVQLKHFIIDIPENHNIIYENGEYFIKIDNIWRLIEPKDLDNILYHDNVTDMIERLHSLEEKVNHNVDIGVTKNEIEEFKKFLTKEYRLPILT